MVYVTSDTHGAFDIHKINPREFTAAQSMGSDDYLLICGDFGCIWDGGKTDEFWLKWLESLPWTTLFIDGNHENFDVLSTYPVREWAGGKIREIRKNIFYLMRGEIYDFAGKTWFALGGGYSHDSSFRTRGTDWWHEEVFSKEEAENALNNLKKHSGKVDVILSHDVYASHSCSEVYPLELDRYPEDRINQMEFLEDIRTRTDYRLWLCGHYHQDSIEFADQKPCRMLFNDVREIDDLMEEARTAKLQLEEKSRLENAEEEDSCSAGFLSSHQLCAIG